MRDKNALRKFSCFQQYLAKLIPRSNYTLHEIALVLPYKQRAIILKLHAVCNCPRSRPLLGRKPAETCCHSVVASKWSKTQSVCSAERQYYTDTDYWQFNVSRIIVVSFQKHKELPSLRSGNFIMFSKTNLGYLSQIPLKNM